MTVSPVTVSPGAAVRRAVARSHGQLRRAGNAGRLPGARRLALPCGSAKTQPGAWFRGSRAGRTWLGGRGARCTHPPTTPQVRSAARPRCPVPAAAKTQGATVTLLRLSPTPGYPVCGASQAFQPSEASGRSLGPPSTACPASSAGLAPRVGPARSPGHCLGSSSVCQALHRGSRAKDSRDDPPPLAPTTSGPPDLRSQPGSRLSWCQASPSQASGPRCLGRRPLSCESGSPLPQCRGSRGGQGAGLLS